MNETVLPNVPDYADLAPVSDQDQQALIEIRDVLERHGLLARFGITLLHNHFTVSSSEILSESIDPKTRTITLRPERRDALSGLGLETSWQFTPSHFGTLMNAYQCCFPTRGGHGTGTYNGDDDDDSDDGSESKCV